MSGLPVTAAAAELGVAPVTLRRWLRAGAPVAKRGGKGRGRATLIDPQAIRAWRDQTSPEAFAMALAGKIPELVAEAVDRSHALVQGPTKRASAGVLAGAWLLVAAGLLDELRLTAPAIPELRIVPEKIDRLRRVANGS